ncbi:MAG: FAD-dependent thymidylate synthase [Deltaproteobacteria bacterium]|nr:FAD-dependent thymidylate synthase [Deltaproteobacteria bacterium]
MDIILAGYNIDYETIKEIKSSLTDSENLTPETISAAYARISRNPLPVNELRKIARKEVDKARRSNRAIVFEMGHNSVAEHAVFNIDVIGVSRLIVEEIEKFRLCSFTEKSQRYIRLKDDFVIPQEVQSAGMRDIFVEMIREQDSLYHELYHRLRQYIFETNQEMASDPANRLLLEGWAKEDARYIVSLATEAQLGMTVNARNLELMLRRSAAHSLKEVNEYGENLYRAISGVAPSLIRYTEANDFDRLTRTDLKSEISAIIKKTTSGTADAACVMGSDEKVVLIDVTPDGDDSIIAALVHSSTDLPMDRCRSLVAKMFITRKEDIVRTAFRHSECYYPPLREFEYADLTFEVTVSASCFAQLKRHRLATLTCQDYDPNLGVTIPPAVKATGMKDRFMETVRKTEDVFRKIRAVSPGAAPYILTNAHRKRVAIKLNVRELYHISRLREDQSAQWDIRETVARMVKLGRDVLPMTLMMACGKDCFESLRSKMAD